MGQIVLVPPAMRYQRIQSGYGNADMTPVVFQPMPPVQDHCVIQGHVPIPKTIEMISDPMIAYQGLVNFGRFQVGARDTTTQAASYVHTWPTQLSIDELRAKFWDFSEIQDFVRDNLIGDVLAQYNEEGGRWQFMVCHVKDHIAWDARVSQTKAYEFALDGRLTKKVTDWLRAECGIFDLIESRGYNGPYPIRVYIKDEDEALYFKMRWSGIDVEKELAESA